MITFSQKKCRFFSFFEKLLRKSTVYRLSRFHFFDQLVFFLKFWSISWIIIRAPLWSLSAKKVPVFQFFRKVARKSTVYRLSRFDFFDQPNFCEHFFCWIYIRAPLWSLSAKKSAGLASFFEKLLQKVQSIGCLDFIFSTKNFFFNFFLESLSELHCDHFQPKKVPVFQFFRKVTPKSTVYRLSRFHFFDPTRIFFPIFFLNLYQSSIVITFSPKKVHRISSFFEKLLEKVQSIGCLDFIFSTK